MVAGLLSFRPIRVDVFKGQLRMKLNTVLSGCSRIMSSQPFLSSNSEKEQKTLLLRRQRRKGHRTKHVFIGCITLHQEERFTGLKFRLLKRD